MAGKVVGGVDAHAVDACGVASAYAPYLVDGVEARCLDAALVGVDDAAVVVAGVFLGEV